MTYSMAAGPRTLAPVGSPPAAGVGASPMLCRNFEPRLWVVSRAILLTWKDAFAIATGSPGAPELGRAGNVGSHSPGAAAAGTAAPSAIAATTVSVASSRLRREFRKLLEAFANTEIPTFLVLD